MFEPSWRLGRIAGIEIRVDPSWTVIALLVAYSLFLRFTLTYRALSGPAGAALAVVATALFFGSVLAHEMTRLVRDAMFSLEKLDVVRPWAHMNAVLDRLEEDGKSFALVLNDGHAVGLLTLADVTRWIIRRRDSLAA